MTRRGYGFTLIELLIVVAIIAILAAIAVPNFLEAQVRAKVSRVKADQRTIATAMESYAVDNNSYPEQRPVALNGYLGTVSLYRLTTPVAYISSLQACLDPFTKQDNVGAALGFDNGQPFLFANYRDYYEAQFNNTNPNLKANGWSMTSFGPDRQLGQIPYAFNDPNVRPLINVPGVALEFGDTGLRQSTGGVSWYDACYDPTNGTVSGGDVGRIGGALPGACAPLFTK